MPKMGRFVVETHGHITTLYQSATQLPDDAEWDGLPMAPGSGEVEVVDNSALALYDMECYGVDMMLLYPSMVGTTNESQLKLVEKYPDKFRAFCSDQGTRLEAHRGGKPWTIDRAAEEIEACLKTGKYCGIGEFVPRDWSPDKIYTFEERFNEYCIFMDMARKYDVPIAFHDLMWIDLPFDTWTLLSCVIRKYPDVKIVVNHGGHSIGAYAFGDWKVRKTLNCAGMYQSRGESNVYLEIGTWTAEMMQLAMEDPNVGPTQLLWGSDYGHVPQYNTVDKNREGKFPTSFSTAMKRWNPVPDYQTDWWGWELHQISKLKDWYGQDEINLILGGNAAKLFKLPVPHERMFLCGRPDINGIYHKESVPFIPIEQVMYPDEKMANKAVLEERKKNPPNWGV